MAADADSALDRRFDAIVFDWDGTAVPDRSADASELRQVIEELCAAGVDVAVVSGTHVGNVDGQLAARPRGPGRLYLLLNRGSEVFRVDAKGVELVFRRAATAEEDAALSRAAELTVQRLASHHGFDSKIVSQRLNRRKIDIIPEPEWAEPSKARMGELLAAVQKRLLRFGFALPQVVETALGAARDAGLADARVTSDAKHVEIGLTDKSDSARWIFCDLWKRGIGPGLVLVAGDELGPLGGLPGSDSLMMVPEAARATVVSVGVEPEGVPAGVLKLGGGPATFVRVLRDQLARRRRRDLPEIDASPVWTLRVDGFDPLLERTRETQLTIADGRFATTGSATGAPTGRPRVLCAGVYEGSGPDSCLLSCPLWSRVTADGAGEERPIELHRTLDLRTGVLREELVTRATRVRIVSLACFARPGTFALRARAPSRALPDSPVLRAPEGEPGTRSDERGTWITVATTEDGSVVAAAKQERLEADSESTLDRVAAYAAAPQTSDAGPAFDKLAQSAGFEPLLAQQRAAWAKRWEDADVVIEGDEQLQRDVRFALFHTMASVADSGEAAVGARGMSGPAYRGHVFWDAEVFVLPFLAATHPESARAMLEYRIRRVAAALARAKAEGRSGARFPWESARDGTEVTPREARDLTGKIVPILTGIREEHIVADVAWGAAHYVDWTGDDAPAVARLIVEAARYWASRVRLDERGKTHIDRVMGPDEYHVEVNDNAFTNVMARWNLRRAFSLVSEDEARRFRDIADALVDGYDEKTGVYEQFSGFAALEPLVIAEIAKSRPVAAEILLGYERVSRAQIVKQPDVLMLHHLVPGEVAPGSLEPNLLFYEPRTAYGSTLAPGISAALFARAWRLDDAVRWLKLTTRIDLDDLTEATARGLHLAAMGSVWQALTYGFAGVRPEGGMLSVDPRLPDAWRALELRLRFRGSRVVVRVEPEATMVRADPPVRVAPPGRTPVVADERGVRIELRSRPKGGPS